MSWYERHVFPVLMEGSLRGMAAHRRELLAQATGHVLEIGVGTGLNLPWYPPTVSDLTLLTPEAALDRRAARRLAKPGLPYRVLHASAEAIPLPAASIDTVVATFVLCTIPDAAAAAREMARVLRPNGQLLVLEHVRSPRPAVARWQRRLDPLWCRLAAGCHVDRPTAAVLAGAGFATGSLTAFHKAGLPIVADFMEGRLPKA